MKVKVKLHSITYWVRNDVGTLVEKTRIFSEESLRDVKREIRDAFGKVMFEKVETFTEVYDISVVDVLQNGTLITEVE